MKFLVALAGLISLASAAPKPGKHGFTTARPGGIKDIIISEDNTVNSTYVGDETIIVRPPQTRLAPDAAIEIVNNFGGGPVNMYITALDDQDRRLFVAADGSLVYPSSGGSTTPVPITENIAHPLPGPGETYRTVVPLSVKGGRAYFAEGQLPFFMVFAGDGRDSLVEPDIKNPADPSAGVNYGFGEFTQEPSGTVWSNISFVDFVGLILSMVLRSTDGTEQTVVGLPGGSVPSICAALAAQTAADGRPWQSLCVDRGDGVPFRVLSPESYTAVDPAGFAGYYEGYVDEVWERYRSEDLVINTQSAAGEVACRVNGDVMECAGSNKSYQKPTTEDIWGCNSGPFVVEGSDNDVHRPIVPRLCAAFYRSTLLLPGGNRQPDLGPENYYTVDPTSHYGRILHEHHVDGKGYTFSYDDVHPDGSPDTAGLIKSDTPEVLRFIVGGLA
ncbi:hypothetical protein NLU13_7303 [Sarocladium strictum]|uniref:GH64 domain-containing protein n=1 Tax=Sarocladium strictum TaxID=5046 RepID=A0AA39GCK5_SARSR|nr:hypothetical protein NLU13_7303 [Sarocladium strictum]